MRKQIDIAGAIRKQKQNKAMCVCVCERFDLIRFLMIFNYRNINFDPFD